MIDRLRCGSVEQPHRPALYGEGRTWSFDALAEAGRALGDAVGPPDARRALIIARADAATVVAITSLLDRAVPFALLHASSTAAERDDAIAQVRPTWVLDGERLHRTSHRAHAAEQTIVFSSGTTGRAKAVRLSRRALLAAARGHALALPFTRADRWLLSLSPARVGGLSILTRSLAARIPVVLPDDPRFDADALVATIARRRVTLLSLVPAMLHRLLDASVDPGPLRAVLLGGAACPPPLLTRGRAAGWPLLPTYGMSETCAQICTQRLGGTSPRGVGAPLPGSEVRLADDGSIEVRGPTLMKGYLGEPEHHGWLRTGDVGRWLPDGSLEVLGRSDDRIVSAGETIDPAEVEAALLEHRAIHDACVVGYPDDTWGEIVTAIVVSDSLDLPALRLHLEPRLARPKHPRKLVRWPSLPRSPEGKLDRRAARARLGARNPFGSG